MSIQGFNDRVGAQGLRVLQAADFYVSNGANLGDPVSDSSDLMLDDIYQLHGDAHRWRLSLSAEAGLQHLTVVNGSQLGTVGADVHLDCCATFMAPDGATVEALVLVELERGIDVIAATYLLPLGDFLPKTDYALVNIDTESSREKFAGLACVSFTRGTHITMASGAQKPIEDIRVGDKVLTRDNGTQAVRWIGHQTVRACGTQAPIIIGKGVLNNARELRVSGNQRIFLYQREDRLNTGKSEVVVKADLLVNGRDIRRASGGFVEYYQILFDNHEFIFAEGIATESLIVDTRTGPALPREVQAKLGLARPSKNRPDPFDLVEGMIDSSTPADALRGFAV